jgi:hemerythrin-like domain-containing protein
MAVISDLMKVHSVLDELFLGHQRALLRFDLAKAANMLKAYERTLASHMADEEELLLPIYAKKNKFPLSAAPKIFFDDHKKMRSFIDLFGKTIADLESEPDVELVVLSLLDREAFYLRLSSHHDRREGNFLYPILDNLLSKKERQDILNKIRLRGETHR